MSLPVCYLHIMSSKEMCLLIGNLKEEVTRPSLRLGKIWDKLKYPLFLGRLHCFSMVLGKVRGRFWSNTIINTKIINQHVYGNYPTHLSIGVPLKNEIKIRWLLKEQMIWWCSGGLRSVQGSSKDINFFTVWLVWYERNAVSVLQGKDLLGHYF